MFRNVSFTFELSQLALQEVTVRISGADSSAAPARFLQFNLTFESLGKINDEKLNEAAAECNACKHVEIPFGPNPDDLNAARSPNLLRS